MNFAAWLDNLKTEKQGLAENIAKLERFFDNGNFKAAEFEKAVQLGLVEKETEAHKVLAENQNAEDSENSN